MRHRTLSEELDEPIVGVTALQAYPGGEIQTVQRLTTLKVILMLGRVNPEDVGKVEPCEVCGALIRRVHPRASMFGWCTVCLQAHIVHLKALQAFRKTEDDSA